MPKQQGFTKIEQEEIKKQANSFWDDSTEMMNPLFSLINDAERMWRVQLPEELEDAFREHPDRASLAPPDFYINLKSIRAGLRSLLFSRKPFGQLSEPGKPGVRSEGITKAEWVLQGMLDMQSNGKGFEHEADMAIHQALYGGISCSFIHWVKNREKTPLRNKENGQPIINPETGRVALKDEIVAEYAEIKTIDIRRVRIDPTAEGIKDIRIMGYHYLSGYNDLIEKKRLSPDRYKFNDTELFTSSFDRTKYFEHSKGESGTYQDKTTDGKKYSDKIVEVKEIRGLFRFEKAGGKVEFKDLVVMLGNEKVVLAIWENDLPISGYELFDFPSVDNEVGRMFPMGLCEAMMDAWVEKFIKRNQSLDEASRRTYPRYIADSAAAASLPDYIEDTPGKVIKIDLLASGLNSVDAAMKPLQTSTTGQDTFVQADSLGNDIQKGMGLNDYIQGLDPSRAETATAVTELTSGGRSLTAQLANNLKDSYLAPSWRKALILYDFFKGHQENTVYDERGQAFQIRPEETNQFYRIDIDIATQLDMPMMTRRLVEMMPQLIANPLIDQYQLIKTVIEALKLPNKEKLLPPSEYAKHLVEIENAALMYGIPLPVHKQDNDAFHIQVHMEAIQYVRQVPKDAPEAKMLTEEALLAHIEEHQISGQQKAAELSNTKDIGGGAGNQINATAPATKQTSGAIRGTPSDRRK